MKPKAEGADCASCPLKDRPFVPTRGPRDARTFIVGEAPGFHETLEGRPFVGPSGKLLRLVMKGAGIAARTTAFTNVVACRPERNADPPKEAIAACAPRLRREIEQARPDRLYALGAFAARALLGNTAGIFENRVGPPKRVPHLPDTDIIPTVHPALALRNQDHYPHLVTDFTKTRSAGLWVEPSVTVAEDPDAAVAALNHIRVSFIDKVVIDVETTTDKDTTFEHVKELLCVGIAWSLTDVCVLPRAILEDPRVRDALRSLLERARVVCQNGKFDVPFLWEFAPALKLGGDTLLAHKCLDERTGVHSLDWMARELLGSPDWKAAQKTALKKWGGWLAWCENDPDDFHAYNGYDCAATFQLVNLLEARVHAEGFSELYAFLLKLSNALMRIEAEGLLINEGNLERLEQSYKVELAQWESRLSEWVVNPRSPKQVTEALARMGVETESTDVAHLGAIADKVAGIQRKHLSRARFHISKDVDAGTVTRFLDELVGYRGEEKAYDTYVKGVRKRLREDGRVYPSYLIHGTVTGRLSARNPNVQNVPRPSTERGKALRNLYRAAPGNVLVACDYKQGELRVVAHLAGATRLLEALNDPARDLFDEVTEQFYGPDWSKENRTKIKNLVYGSLYGGGPAYLSSFVKCTLDEADEFQRFLFREFAPEIPSWQDYTRRLVLRGSNLFTPHFGRRRRFWTEPMMVHKRTREDVLNECLALKPQSLLSDMNSLAAVRLTEREDPDVRVRILLHDALYVETPVTHQEATTALVRDTMESSARLVFPGLRMPVDSSAATHWGDCV